MALFRILRFGRRWRGGLTFGPPGWHAAPQALSAIASAGTPPALPSDVAGLIGLLEQLAIRATSAINPSLLAQLQDLGTPPRRIRALVLNCLPTQPESALPQLLARQGADDLLRGLDLVRRCMDVRRAVIATDRHDFSSRRQLRKVLKRQPWRRGVQIARLLNRYPQAHPTLLLRSLYGKQLEPQALPTRANRVVLDPLTCWLLGVWARTGEPPRQRPVQVFVQDAPPRILMAHIGETIGQLAARLEIPLRAQQVIVNGMLAGATADAGYALDLATEIISIRPVPREEPSSPCIQCGWCVDHCPTALTPIRLYELAPAGKRTGAALEARHCVACGLCSYVCPTRLPLTAHVVALRAQVTPQEVLEPVEQETGDD